MSLIDTGSLTAGRGTARIYHGLLSHKKESMIQAGRNIGFEII